MYPPGRLELFAPQITSVRKFSKNSPNLGENHGSSRTLYVETANLESRTGR